MMLFGYRLLGCTLSVLLCFAGACSVATDEPVSSEDAQAQLQGHLAVVAQVLRPDARTFFPSFTGHTYEGVKGPGLTARYYLAQGAVFAVTAISVIDPNQSSSVSCDAADVNAGCTTIGWIYAIPMFDDREAALSSPYAGGFWLRAEDVVLVQVGKALGDVFDGDPTVVTVKEAHALISGITVFSATQGEPLGTNAAPQGGEMYSPPKADGSMSRVDHNDMFSLTVGASIDPHDSTASWVARGTDGYMLKTHSEVCLGASTPQCAMWTGTDGAVIGAGISGRAKVGGALVVVALLVLLYAYISTQRRPATISVATGVPPILTPALAVTLAPAAPISPPLPTVAPPPPPPTDLGIKACWTHEDKTCRYTFYQNIWYCLCLRPEQFWTEGSQQCGRLDFWPGTWADGCALHAPAGTATVGDACWFPQECPGGKRFHNSL